MATSGLAFKEVDDYCESIKQDRSDRHREIGLNREFFRGVQERHYDAYHPGPYGWPTRRRQPPERADEVRWTSHLMAATIDRISAAVGQTPVYFYGIPKNGNVDSRVSSQMTTHFLQYLRYADDPVPVLNMRVEVASRAQVDGTTFLKAGFDRNGGDALDLPPEVAAGLSEKEKARHYFTGSSWSEVVPWDELLFPRWIRRLPDAPAVVHERHQSIGRVLGRFPKSQELRDLVSQRTGGGRLLDVVFGRRRTGAETFFEDHNLLVREVWIPRGTVWRGSGKKTELREFPQGMLQVFVGDLLVYEQDTPYLECGVDLPFQPVAQSDDPDYGSLEGISNGSKLRGQVPYIELLIRTMLERELFHANPPLFSPVGAVNRNEFLERLPGDVVFYNPARGKPFYEMPASMHQAAQGLLGELVAMMMEDSGVREAARGGVPKRLESGKALALALEQDLARMSNYNHSVDEGFRRHLWHRALMEMKFSLGERQLAIFSRSQLLDVASWRAEAMSGTAGVFRASSPTLNYSPEIMMDRIRQDFQLGLIERETALDMMALPPPEGQGYGVRADEMALIREENRQLLSGREVVTEDFYDQDLHIYGHRQEFLQRRWEMTEQQVGHLADHIADHQQRQVLSMMGTQQIAEAVRGMQGPSPGAIGM